MKKFYTSPPRIRLLFGIAITLIAWPIRAETIDFNDLSLATGSPSYATGTSVVTGHYYNGPTANSVPVVDSDGDNALRGTFASGTPAGVQFINDYDTDFNTSSGFAVSNVKDTTDFDFTNQYAAFTGLGAGKGVNGAADNYAISAGYLDQKANDIQSFDFNPSDPAQLAKLPFFQLPQGYKIENMEVTNTTYAALTMLNGNSFAKQFGAGDYFQLSVYGTNAAGQALPNSVRFYLADFLGDAHNIVQDWTTLDLSALSNAATLYFNLSSSDVGEFGMNTPGYFALDNIQIQSVPEPSSFALFCSASIWLVLIARYRRGHALRSR